MEYAYIVFITERIYDELTREYRDSFEDKVFAVTKDRDTALELIRDAEKRLKEERNGDEFKLTKEEKLNDGWLVNLSFTEPEYLTRTEFMIQCVRFEIVNGTKKGE